MNFSRGLVERLVLAIYGGKAKYILTNSPYRKAATKLDRQITTRF